jgi:hypothetical protein
MSYRSDAVKRWREKFKARIVAAFGGACACCGYKRCQDALQFHHLDPNEKDFRFGKIRANPRNWASILDELRKCVMLCANCHREVHRGITQVPDDAPRFDETFADYKALASQELMDNCPVCGNQKPKRQITCSLNCAGKKARRVDWDAIDLPDLLGKMSYMAIGEKLGVSDVAVRKRAKKLNLLLGYDSNVRPYA